MSVHELERAERSGAARSGAKRSGGTRASEAPSFFGFSVRGSGAGRRSVSVFFLFQLTEGREAARGGFVLDAEIVYLHRVIWVQRRDHVVSAYQTVTPLLPSITSKAVTVTTMIHSLNCECGNSNFRIV